MIHSHRLIQASSLRFLCLGALSFLVTVAVAEENPVAYETVMPVPLNASVQQVSDVLGRYGGNFSCAFKEQDRQTLLDVMRRNLKASYDRFRQTNKEPGLRAFDRQASHLLPTFFFGREKYILAPSSFRCLAGANMYQVFEKTPQAYFSQFALSCEDLPPKLRLFGMTRMVVLFTSFEGEPPRSCIVAYANPRYPASLKHLPTVPILQGRYGQPKVHFNVPQDCPEAVCILDALKRLHPSRTRKTGDEAIWNTTVFTVSLGPAPAGQLRTGTTYDPAIWKRVVTSGCANDSYAESILAFPFFLPHSARMLPAPEDEPVALPCPPFKTDVDCTVDYTLEWRLGRTRILVGGAEFLGALTTVHYVDYPSFLRLQTLYSKFLAASKHQKRLSPAQAVRISECRQFACKQKTVAWAENLRSDAGKSAFAFRVGVLLVFRHSENLY
jgi:hypothetical protein